MICSIPHLSLNWKPKHCARTIKKVFVKKKLKQQQYNSRPIHIGIITAQHNSPLSTAGKQQHRHQHKCKFSLIRCAYAERRRTIEKDGSSRLTAKWHGQAQYIHRYCNTYTSVNHTATQFILLDWTRSVLLGKTTNTSSWFVSVFVSSILWLQTFKQRTWSHWRWDDISCPIQHFYHFDAYLAFLIHILSRSLDQSHVTSARTRIQFLTFLIAQRQKHLQIPNISSIYFTHKFVFCALQYKINLLRSR